MTRNVWHKRYHGDALNGCMGLTLEERGAYATILDLMYDTDWAMGIPDQDRWIAGHMNISVRKWCALRERLTGAGKLDMFEGLISNSRYRKERELALEISRKRSENGASGGRKSGEKRSNTAENVDSVEAIASVLPLYAGATDTETDTETEKNKKESKGAYAFAGKVVRLNHDDLSRWTEVFSRLDVPALLQSRDDWLSTQKQEIQKKWFNSTSNWLAKTQQEATNQAKAVEKRKFVIGP